MPPDLSHVQAVLFDLDDTLVNWRQAEAQAIEGLASGLLAHAGVERARVVEAYAGIMAENFLAFRTHRQWMYVRDRLALLMRRLAIEGLDVEEVTARFSEEARRHLRFLDGAAEALHLVRASGRRLGLLTNGVAEVQRPKVERFGLEARVDAIAISGETGLWKPDVAAFHSLLRRLGVRPEDALMVGDSLEFDIRPAKSIGMATCWIDPLGPGHEDADVTVTTPRQLLPMLGRAQNT